MNPFWTCELYDYIQEEKRLFIYAIDKDTNRPIQIDAEQDLDYFEDYDNLTIFIEEKGKVTQSTYKNLLCTSNDLKSYSLLLYFSFFAEWENPFDLLFKIEEKILESEASDAQLKQLLKLASMENERLSKENELKKLLDLKKVWFKGMQISHLASSVTYTYGL